MKLICEKYREEVNPENIRCPHPDDYCKWRQSCIVYFMWKEQKHPGKEKKEQEKDNG